MASERVQRRIDRLLDQVEEAVDQLDWETVVSRAQAVLALDPNNADAVSFLVSAERAFGNAASPAIRDSKSDSPSANTAANPSSFADGRYQVQRVLGEGGKKKVYLAHDTTLDRDVAFALIKTEGMDTMSRTRIQREAQAMGRLGAHPHIVTVFDLGEEGDQPFMVTELMSGGDVERLIKNAPGHQLPMEQSVKIAQETCRGLEFAHSREIVHRDMKPGNVWITADGVAKIGDFGLAVSLDRSRITQEGMMVGTVSYIPPEQAMGGEITAKSDLYSLGAMLYEMVTGRPPFLGDDSVAIIGQHINTPPVAPTWHNGQCPRSLEALIMRMLAKDPSERPNSAGDVLAALEGIDLAISGENPAVSDDEVYSLDRLAGGVFVGRQREMGDLKAALEDALSGQGRLVTLVGDPGIGKTRTALELATYAGLRQAQVLWGRCYEGEGAPPYWPWVQAIRSYVRDVDPEQLRSEMGSGAADIAEVVSEIRTQLPGLDSPPQLDPEQARFRLFDSITAFLKNAAQSKPIVLMLDDLHWADHPSLMLLEFVARELGNARVMIIGAYRDIGLSRQHPLSQTLGELSRERLFQRVLLRGLEQEDVSRFIELVAGTNPPRGLAEAVHRQTEGNPLFITEVVRLLAQEGELAQKSEGDRDSWSFHIPEGVREVIRRRLDRLSDRCNESLATASVIGREFGLEHLSLLIVDSTRDRLLEVLDEALSARVIEELPRVAGRYQFTHALIQESLMGELSATRKIRLHTRVAETLEELYGDEAESHAAEMAFHFAEAEAELGAEKLVHYAKAAGERALASHAWEEAQTHFELGLSRNGQSQLTDESAELYFGLGQAQAALLQFDVAVESLRRAFDHFSQTGNAERAVVVATFPLPYQAAHIQGLSEMVVGAFEMVQLDSLDAALLLSRHAALFHAQDGEYEHAEEALGRALKITRKEKDERLEISILAETAFVDAYEVLPGRSLANSINVLELATRLSDQRSEVIARFYAGLALIVLGDPDGAQRHFSAGIPIAEKVRDQFSLASLFRGNMLVHQIQGEWESARSFNDKALEAWPDDLLSLSPRVKLEYETGDFAEGGRYLEKVFDSLQNTAEGRGFERSVTAVCLAMADRIAGTNEFSDAARNAAEAVLSFSSGAKLVQNYANATLGIVAVHKKDLAQAAAQYPILLPMKRAIYACEFGIDRLLGLLAQVMGDIEISKGHFEDALLSCRNSGYRPELAWTCCDYAEMLLERNDEGDLAEADSLLGESLAISTELGMLPLLERVTALLERVKSQPVETPAYPDGLTQREVEVLRLVCAGKTNREIADELIIAVNTAGKHVSNILDKTGTINRTGAARYATRNGLVAPNSDSIG